MLDAFAGSGALGIEALSRSARSATFIERDGAQARAIEADLARLHQTAATVRCGDALRILAEPATAKFDIVLLDPPFDSGLWSEAMASLDTNGWLAPDAWIYVDSGTDDAWNAPARWRLHRQRDAGAVRGNLYRVGAA